MASHVSHIFTKLGLPPTLVYPCDRWGPDGLEPAFVGGFADLLGEAVVRAYEIGDLDTEVLAHLLVAKVEDNVELQRHRPKLARQEICHLEALTAHLVLQLGDDAGPSDTQIEDGEASARVEAAALAPCTLAARRIEPGCLAPVGRAAEA